MKRLKKIVFTSMAILITLLCSIYPRYYVYASDPVSDPVSQEVTSDDNIVQQLFNYAMSYIGACNKASHALTGLPTTIQNNVKETIASAMNGGGIYVDANGDYVFSNEACDQIYQALSNNSSVDANVISNFSSFTYQADGYVNAQFLTDCNSLTSYYKIPGTGDTDGVNGGQGVSGNYMLISVRSTKGDKIITNISAFDVGNVAFISISNSGNTYSVNFYDTNASLVRVPWGYACCCYRTNESKYYNTVSQRAPYNNPGNFLGICSYNTNNSNQTYPTPYYGLSPNGQSGAESLYNGFPSFNGTNGSVFSNVDGAVIDSVYFYCSNSLIMSKSVVAGNGLLVQSDGVFYQKFDNTVVNKTILENNNWENIYNSYIQNINVDYQKDTSMTPSDVRKIMKKYSGSIIDAINSGSSNIEDTISISNRYLQAISVDVRNISEQLQDIANGGSSGGSGGGITEDQYNSIMGKLDDINDNAIDIASSTATISSDIDAIYEDTHGISEDMAVLLENSADTNTNLVAIHTLLNNINNKIRNRNHDNPLPDDNFWMLLDDELDDYTDTLMDSLLFKLQMIGTVLQGVVPFGYVAVIGVMLNALAVQPEDPVFEIDLNSDNTTIPIHYNGTIDLSWVADIMPMVRAFQVMLFILGLIWASFEIFTTLGSLFG